VIPVKTGTKRVNRLKHYIAIFLFGIFIFPVTFQSFHIVWHDSNGYDCDHHSCRAEQPDKGSSSDEKILYEEEITCPICEYKISITGVLRISVSTAFVPASGYHYKEIVPEQQFRQVLTNRSPRAPPVYFS
jgi:hypothetical protein